MTTRKTAVVTGASRGIGRAIAKRLASSHEIVAVARNREQLDSLAKEITDKGGKCRPLVLDVGNPEATEWALGSVDADVLVNNAGIGVLRPMLQLSLDDWHRMVNVNFNALFYVTRVLLPKMIRRGGGTIVNIGSLAGRNTFAGGTCYAATKHAVVAFSESLMLEVRDSNVRVAMVMPGSVSTHFGQHSGDMSWMLTSEDVAETVAFIIEQRDGALVSRVEMRPAKPKRVERQG
ncbi:MAG TPA: SDR family NAD(P)-dependent oxidoreductase [Gemmatimonadaceae bacterium]|nr:SDR family NAD(P)-dependent oxidoreductase [Gemmatimonadaceae bacterium]